MVWIKICGITRASDGEAISGMGADCLGFIFSTDSPRKISLEKARSITSNTAAVSKTGVFVNEKTAMVIKYVKELGLDNVQLSGDEDIAYMEELKSAAPEAKIIKAIRIREDSGSRPVQLDRIIKSFSGSADYILLDSYDKDKYGGTGKTIDWQLIRGLANTGCLILSGGLDHENIYNRLCAIEPFGVDASSRLEAAPGIKDLKRVEKFIAEVRRYEKQL
ncbi:MAG TPA: N-(5'-phosphoribosyl)anthranilate isomerase [Actinobacteria bacterium]|nr:N-(5'-phosphoribosyl)anthranilate isomerase [Actinomycetota bacterium]